MNITIVGLGLIGGSVALDLKSQMNVHVIGVDTNLSHQEAAMDLGLVHEVMDLDAAVLKSDIIILAVPVDIIELILPNLLDNISKKSVLIDLGSTKDAICKMIWHHKNRGRFVAAHPLAGTEFSGPKAALRGLFQNKKNIICESEKSDPDALALALRLFDSLGMKTSFMSAQDHDKHLAYVSHLSHVSSFMLGLTVLDIEKDEKQIFDLAGTGFASTVRLAKSHPSTWAAIFDKNSKFVLEALDSYIAHLQQFRSMIEAKDIDCLKQLMTKSNDIKRILE
ncbi:MAG: prephenate dehydrogenase [Saprospiraceae bacterium]|jgi:prephenate dehydrogenase